MARASEMVKLHNIAMGMVHAYDWQDDHEFNKHLNNLRRFFLEYHFEYEANTIEQILEKSTHLSFSKFEWKEKPSKIMNDFELSKKLLRFLTSFIRAHYSKNENDWKNLIYELTDLLILLGDWELADYVNSFLPPVDSWIPQDPYKDNKGEK